LGQNNVAKINGKRDNNFKMEENNIEEVHKFAYFSRAVTDTSGAQEDVDMYIHNTNRAFIQIDHSWIATEISTAKW
jgi:hypothetical protein